MKKIILCALVTILGIGTANALELKNAVLLDQKTVIKGGVTGGFVENDGSQLKKVIVRKRNCHRSSV